MSHSLTPNERRARLERITVLAVAVAATGLASAGAHATTECQPWNSATAYVAGGTVTEAGKTYEANWWTQGNDPATSSGATGSGQPWTITTSCAVCHAAGPGRRPHPPPPPRRRLRRLPRCRPRRLRHRELRTVDAGTAYNAGAVVTEGGKDYKANWWTQGDDPATHNGVTGSGQVWTIVSSCSATPTPPAPPAPTPPSPPPAPTPPSPPPAPTPPSPPPSSGALRPHVLMGYWQNFNNGAPVLTIAQVPTTYDIIAVAFANSTTVPGQISFAIDPGVTGYTDAQFRADIVTAHARGQKIVLSIGGQNGSISVSDSASASAFANSAASILTSYGFDGIDIDLENGINPSSMASAISQLEAVKPGRWSRAAPQTLDTQNAQSSYFSFASMIGANMTMMNTQYYNSGSRLGCDGGVDSVGNENFVTALACPQLHGLPAPELGIGSPAPASAGGSGYVSPSVVVADPVPGPTAAIAARSSRRPTIRRSAA